LGRVVDVLNGAEVAVDSDVAIFSVYAEYRVMRSGDVVQAAAVLSGISIALAALDSGQTVMGSKSGMMSNFLPLQLLLATFAAWLNRHQAQTIPRREQPFDIRSRLRCDRHRLRVSVTLKPGA
jgi:hypothetical protein